MVRVRVGGVPVTKWQRPTPSVIAKFMRCYTTEAVSLYIMPHAVVLSECRCIKKVVVSHCTLRHADGRCEK